MRTRQRPKPTAERVGMNEAQRRLLWLLIKESAMDEPTRREWMLGVTGKISMTKVTSGEATKLIRDLRARLGKGENQKGFVENSGGKGRGVPPFADPDSPPSAEQTELIFRMLGDMGAVGTAKTHWIKWQIGQHWPQHRWQAAKIIEALKRMSAKGFQFKQDGQDGKDKAKD
jgi:hypothetical protein